MYTSYESDKMPFCSLSAAEWLGRMEHLQGATNLTVAGDYGIQVASARNRDVVGGSFPTCAERFSGCARLPDSYRDVCTMCTLDFEQVDLSSTICSNFTCLSLFWITGFSREIWT